MHTFKALFFLFAFLPFSFFGSTIIENTGQINQITDNENILFYTATEGGYVCFLKDRISFVLSKSIDKQLVNNIMAGSKTNTFRYDLKIPGATETLISPGEPLTEKINFYTNKGSYSVNQYRKISYRNTALGFSLFFYNHPEKGLKYDIVFDKPRTTTVDFTFELIGATAKKSIDVLTNKETLIIETPMGNVIERLPLVYADVTNYKKTERKEQACTISITNDKIKYSVNVPANCNSVVIDPWASFVGGNSVDECFGTDGDNAGNVYVSGYTQSLDFPSSPGVFQAGLNANYDAYIFKFDPNGQRLWATYYGGSQNDFGYRLKVSPSGKPTLSGYTYSSDLYVSPTGVFSSSFSGSIDAFIAQFDSNGNFLWGTFAGGSGGDFAISMDMGKLGFIAIAGFTSSSDFPVSPGAWQPTLGGALDCFLAKFDSTGNRVWSTFMGGTNSEDGHSIKFDSFGNIIIAGDTYSANFPVSAGAYQNFLMGGGDAFVAKFNNSGTNLWSTYLGGSGNEDIDGLTSDANNVIYFTGYSTSTDFPVSVNAFQSTMNGVRDLTAGSFDAGGALRWLTYAGGAAWDAGKDIIINTNKKIILCGETNSTDFPIIGSKYDTLNNGSSDVLYMTFDTTGAVELSNLFGGSNADYAHAICETTQNTIIISGNTYSLDFPVSAGVFQTTQNGDVDAFVWQEDSTSIITALPITENNITAYLYPNPANDKVIITNIPSGKYNLLIFDILGKEIRNEQCVVINEKELNGLENLDAGVYSIFLISGNNSLIFKLVKP